MHVSEMRLTALSSDGKNDDSKIIKEDGSQAVLQVFTGLLEGDETLLENGPAISAGYLGRRAKADRR
jgi:hypothetical protein